MRLLRATLATIIAVGAAAPAGAQVLKFDEILGGGTAPVLVGDFYNGGGGPAFNFGVEFVGDVYAFCLNRAAVPSCSNTSWGGDPAAAARGTESAGLAFTSGSPIMNRVAGFATGFSFYFANPFAVGAEFEVWSGLNATGTLLASATMPATPNGGPAPNCFSANYCPYVANSVAFAGTAHSVRFTGDVRLITYDDITFGSVIPGVLAPEPATVALLGGGLLALGAVARRRARA